MFGYQFEFNNQTTQRCIMFLHHIPKTAGTSAYLDLNRITHSRIGSQECCYVNAANSSSNIVSFLRDPTEHVYSQFLECKYDKRWGTKVTKNTSFPRNGNDVSDFLLWLRHFQKVNATDFNCYHPYNMQTRSFDPYCTDTHKYLKFSETAPMVAVHNMMSLSFVGLQDLYRLSLCMMVYFTLKYFPDECKCGQSMKTHKITHFVPTHSVRDLNTEHFELIDSYTQFDKTLYRIAVERFWVNVKSAERNLNMSLSCMYQ